MELFNPQPFAQIPGQIALATDVPRRCDDCGKPAREPQCDTSLAYCDECAPICKKCGAPAVFPKYAMPDLCAGCSAAAWARINAKAALLPAQPGNDVTNVWD